MISTSKASLADSLAASREAAPVSSLATISSMLMRPEPNTLPFMNTMGTAMISRSVTSFWKAPPSITVVLTLGLRIAISDSA